MKTRGERLNRMRLTIAAAFVVASASACGGSNRSAILYEGADRPGGEKIEGPAPPSDYKFGPTERVTPAARVTDTNGDARADRVEYMSNGELVGTAEDTNYDGKVDVYKKVSHGVVVEEVRDRNFDGILDVRSRDTNGDGKLDLTEPLTP